MSIAKTVFEDVAAKLGDPGGEQFADQAFLLPYVNAGLRQLVQDVLTNPNIPKYKAYVVLPGVPAGTTSLAAIGLFDDGKPLALLGEPELMWEKKSGQQDQYYSEMSKVSVIPVGPAGLLNGCFQSIADTNAMSQDILLVGATQDLDLRLFGSFEARPVVDENSPIPPQTDVAIGYLAAALAAIPYGNVQLAKIYRDEYRNAADSLASSIIIAQQEVVSRPRPFSEGMYESDLWIG